jgi:hypothetical protein
MLENIGKATNKNPLIYASPKFFASFCSQKVVLPSPSRLKKVTF